MKPIRVLYPFGVLMTLTLVCLSLVFSPKFNQRDQALAAPLPQGSNPASIQGPFTSAPVIPTVYNGDLRDLPQLNDSPQPGIPQPLRYIPGQEPKGSAPQLAGWHDSVVQSEMGAGLMPDPIANFPGLDKNAFGSGWPPDTNGDVGPNHYIQTVNTSIGIYDKATGNPLTELSFNDFFTGPAGSACNTSNDGDPVVIYDGMADRWIVTDFAWFNFNTGPYYECIAVSQGPNPVTDGWYFYELRADTGSFTGYLNDYPKLGVWPDGWYMTANMFEITGAGTGFGVRVWALDRDSMLIGDPLNEVHFDLCTNAECGALLPSNMRGALPPAGSPNFVATVSAPNILQIWEFDVDWITPANSTFTGPVDVPVANFVSAQSVPQLGSGVLLDSLSFRPMMQLQYRNLDGTESLWLNHTVAAGEGIGGVRWYEVQDPGGTPNLVQQSTYQPDETHRWMGSLAVDQDGNMAVGFSASSSTMHPAIRYAGRLAGEVPGELGQGEATLIAGTGSQTGISRWGDYSTMTVDPVDDCTFWYTTEYYVATGTNWQTRIGSFKFPSCGQAKAYLDGYVYNSASGAPIADVSVAANSPTQTLTVQTDSSGYYTMTLLADTIALTAGPMLPGYPVSNTVTGVTAVTGSTTSNDLYLDPSPYLEGAGVTVDDSGIFGNNNGYLEPGETGVGLYPDLTNTGAITATTIVASLNSTTPGVTITANTADYPNIAAGDTLANLSPYVVDLATGVTCGADIDFQQLITSTEGTYSYDFTLNAAVPLPLADIFNNDVEGGAAGWTTGGTNNTWAITTIEAHSPTHSWADSPGGVYADNTNSYLRTPALDLSGKRNIQLTGWYKFGLETGYDYVYLEYSLNGGSTWQTNTPLYSFNGNQSDWVEIPIDASVLDNEPNVALRWRLVSDAGVVDDGIYIDDVILSYEPFTCDYTAPTLGVDLAVDMEGSGEPGTAVTYTIQLTNTGSITDTYNISATGVWTATVTPPSVILGSSQTTTVSLMVFIPADAANEETDTTTVTATSTLSPEVSDAELVTTTAVIVPVYSVELSGDDAMSGDPGDVITYTLTVTNAGNVMDTFNIDISGETWSVSAPANVMVNAGASTTFDVVVTIPASAMDAESDMVTVTVTSANDAGATDSADLTTTAVINSYYIYLPMITTP